MKGFDSFSWEFGISYFYKIGLFTIRLSLELIQVRIQAKILMLDNPGFF